jgi:hypothetical protein
VNTPAPDPAADPACQRFLQRLAEAAQPPAMAWQRLLLAKPQGAAAGDDLQRVAVRPLLLRGQPHLSFVYSHATKDITKNLPLPQGLAQVAALLGHPFRNAHLHTPTEELQLMLSKKGRGHLTVRALPASTAPAPAAAGAAEAATAEATPPPAPPAHDRAKQRWLSLDRPFLAALGVATSQGTLVPAMARKWKQINKFVEIFAHAIDSAGLARQPGIEVVDFGAGRAYLTFAVHDWLTHGRGLPARVTGVELRPELVAEGNASIARLGLQGLRLQQGDVRDWQAEPMDVMIALHACDTATDHAIHLGLQAGARVILCSPCCHKQLRPQLLAPHPLRSVFQHGIHAEQQAEMLTDSLRALLLESRGYETQVFEFVALEHTRKNKMILAVQRRQPRPELAAAALAQVAELKRFFGVREQALEALLGA